MESIPRTSQALDMALLVEAFGYGYSLGAGITYERPADDQVAAILAVVRIRWEATNPIEGDEALGGAPAWLRAHAERQALERKDTS